MPVTSWILAAGCSVMMGLHFVVCDKAEEGLRGGGLALTPPQSHARSKRANPDAMAFGTAPFQITNNPMLTGMTGLSSASRDVRCMGPFTTMCSRDISRPRRSDVCGGQFAQHRQRSQ